MPRAATIRYRRCRREDLLPAVRLMLRTINDLRRRTDQSVMRRRPRAVPPLLAHVWETDRESLATAWRGDRLVGFAGAVNRGRQWYLAWLFVEPALQGRGIGRRLLARVWRAGRTVTHALGTFAYNPQAIGLYSHFGLSPIAHVPMLRAAVDDLRLTAGTDLELVSTPRRGELSWLRALDARVRGYPHPPEWRYWQDNRDLFEIQLFRRRGRPVGYSMMSKDGLLGPAGATTAGGLRQVVRATLRAVADGRLRRPDRVMIACPGEHIGLYRDLIEARLRLFDMTILMSDAPFADLRRYVPATLALF